MEDSMDIVAKKCGRELATFQNCILSNPQDLSICDASKASLTSCASEAIPLLSAIKNQCSRQIMAFDTCIKSNIQVQDGRPEFQGRNRERETTDEEMVEKCGAALTELWRCTEVVKRREGVKGPTMASSLGGGGGGVKARQPSSSW